VGHIKKIIMLSGIIIFVAATFLLAFRIIASEDGWVCLDGQWIKNASMSQ
jgi:hypothetical protein